MPSTCSPAPAPAPSCGSSRQGWRRGCSGGPWRGGLAQQVGDGAPTKPGPAQRRGHRVPQALGGHSPGPITPSTSSLRLKRCKTVGRPSQVHGVRLAPARIVRASWRGAGSSRHAARAVSASGKASGASSAGAASPRHGLSSRCRQPSAISTTKPRANCNLKWPGHLKPPYLSGRPRIMGRASWGFRNGKVAPRSGPRPGHLIPAAPASGRCLSGRDRQGKARRVRDRSATGAVGRTFAPRSVAHRARTDRAARGARLWRFPSAHAASRARSPISAEASWTASSAGSLSAACHPGHRVPVARLCAGHAAVIAAQVTVIGSSAATSKPSSPRHVRVSVPERDGANLNCR